MAVISCSIRALRNGFGGRGQVALFAGETGRVDQSGDVWPPGKSDSFRRPPQINLGSATRFA